MKQRSVSAKRKPVGNLGPQSVSVEPLRDDVGIPFVICPQVPNMSLAGWATHNRTYVDELLITHRALLFRGFSIDCVAQFEAFVAATSDKNLLAYRDRTTPRTTKGNRVYSSTEHPADQRINPHNEGTYWTQWAMKLYFCCLQAPTTGGQTPISDVRRVYDNIDPGIRRKFLDKKMMLARNFGDGLGLSWQEAYQTDSKAEAEAFFRANDIEYEWHDDGHLKTRQVRAAVRYHPQTGERVWFNHAAFYHYSTLDTEIREAMLSEFGQDGLPYNTYYGDGESIEPDVAAHLRKAYAQEQVMFDWRNGDVMLLDNMSVSHAREPYSGDRNVVVAMTDAVQSRDCEENAHV